MQAAECELRDLLEAHEITRGMLVRAQGAHLYLGREEPPGPFAADEPDDRIRLTRVGASERYGLSVRRHTGRWEKTPYSGPLPDLVQVICETMQHLVAP